MAMYGKALKGAHKGEMTPCHAKDMETCPYHSPGSHRDMTPTQVQAFNEHAIAQQLHSGGTASPNALSKRNQSPSPHKGEVNSSSPKAPSLAARLKTKARSFMDRRTISPLRAHAARRMAASVLVMVSLMGAGACGNPYYTETVDVPESSVQTPGTGNESSRNESTWLDDPAGKAEDAIGKAQDKLKEYQDSGRYDQDKQKAKELLNKGKNKLKDAAGSASEYVQSGQAGEDLKNAGSNLQSMLDSLSSYGIGGSLGNVNSSSSVNGVYANVDKETALRELSSLRIEQGNKAGYDRTQWKHWIATIDAPDGAGTGRKACFDVREQVLARQGQDVRLIDNGCEVTAVLTDPYTGTTGHSRKDMQIDHSVPLGYAYAHGGAGWSSQKKQDYANDLTQGHLVAALGTANQAKSDKGPSEWMPDKDQCGYAKNFTHILYRWDLSTTKADHDVMQRVIQQCAA